MTDEEFYEIYGETPEEFLHNERLLRIIADDVRSQD